MTLEPTDILIIIGLFGIFALLFIALGGGRARRMHKRIDRLQNRKAVKPKSAEAELHLRRKQRDRISPVLTALMKPLPDVEVLNNKIARAGYSIGARQYLFRCVLMALVIAFVVVIAHKPIYIGLGAGLVLGVLLPVKILSMKINKTKKQFLALFPDGIDLIVRGLRSGLPVADSITLVSHEVPDPVGKTFGYVVNMMKLGVTMEKALQDVAKKLDYTEFNFFVTSIILQRETGGNLGEILNNLSDVLRKRLMMQLKIKAMTSEARATLYILGALPIVVSGAVTVMSPGYLDVLFTDPRGEHAGEVALGMMFSGIWLMRRMGKFEI